MFLQIQGERKHIGQIVCIIAVFLTGYYITSFFPLSKFQSIFGFFARSKFCTSRFFFVSQFLLLGFGNLHFHTPV